MKRCPCLWMAVILLVSAGCSAPSGGRPSAAAASSTTPRNRHLAGQPEPGMDPADVLQVNGDTITAQELLKPFSTQLSALAARNSREAFAAFVQEWSRGHLAAKIRDVLMYQEASRALTDAVSPAIEQAVDQEIKDRVNRDYAGRQARLEEALAEEATSLAQYREQIRKQIVIVHYLQEQVRPQIADPTRRELLEFYERNLDQYTEPQRRELFMIEVPKGGAPEQARQRIDAAWTRLRDGDPFEDVARAYSQGLHASDGGDWGPVTSALQGRYAPVSEVFFGLTAHTHSGVIESADAFFIVMAGDVQPARRQRFVDVQPKLVGDYREEHYKQLRDRVMETLYNNAIIHPEEDEFLKAVLALALQEHFAATKGI